MLRTNGGHEVVTWRNGAKLNGKVLYSHHCRVPGFAGSRNVISRAAFMDIATGRGTTDERMQVDGMGPDNRFQSMMIRVATDAGRIVDRCKMEI